MFDAIPEPTLRRLPAYLRLLRDMEAVARPWVSCTHLSEALDLDPTQVRKDLAFTGIIGRPKVGYQVPVLVHAIEKFLGWNNVTDTFLIGAGNLGSALLGFQGFGKHGLGIVAAFDNDASRAGSEIHGKPVFHMSRLAELVNRMHVKLGVLAVPEDAAVSAASAMRDAGIVAIWNFTPVKLNLEGVMIEDVDLAASLAVLSHRLVSAMDQQRLAARVASAPFEVAAG